MNFFRQLSLAALVLLFSLSVFAAGSCTLNGQPVECPQFLNDYGWLIAGIFILIILAVIIFIAFSMFKAWSTGSISITLPKTIFIQGETITGAMGITLKKQIEVDSANVQIQGERTTTTYRNGQRFSETKIFYQTSVILQTKPTYPIGVFQENFTIGIPSDILSKGKIDASGLGAIGGAINFLQDMAVPKPKWYVFVELKTKNNIDFTNRVQIQIS